MSPWYHAVKTIIFHIKSLEFRIHLMMERFPPQKPETLSPEDKKLWDELSEVKDNLFGDQYVLH